MDGYKKMGVCDNKAELYIGSGFPDTPFFLVDGDFCMEGQLDTQLSEQALDHIQKNDMENENRPRGIYLTCIGKDDPGKVKIETSFNKSVSVKMFFREGNRVVAVLVNFADLLSVF